LGGSVTVISSNEAFSAKLCPLVSEYVCMTYENDIMHAGFSKVQSNYKELR